MFGGNRTSTAPIQLKFGGSDPYCQKINFLENNFKSTTPYDVIVDIWKSDFRCTYSIEIW